METVLRDSSRHLLHQMVNNKQVMSAATIAHWKLPFCIALGLMDLPGSIVFCEVDLVLEFDGDEG